MILGEAAADGAQGPGCHRLRCRSWSRSCEVPTRLVIDIYSRLPRAESALRTLSEPRPKEAPPGAIMWPIWYLGFVFNHNRRFGALYVFGLILSMLYLSSERVSR